MPTGNGRQVAIVGAGVAGLCAGIYAQMNGYRSTLYEMHTVPGGLCTAWERKDYTIDLCIHWLVGSNPNSDFYRLWEEVGLVQGREFLDLDELFRVEDENGRRFIWYTDLDQLEDEVETAFAQDAAVFKELTAAARSVLTHMPPGDAPPPGLMTPLDGIRLLPKMLPAYRVARRWLKVTTELFTSRLQDPLLKQAVEAAGWFPEMSLFFLVFNMAFMHNRDAGYPIGGSMPMARALEKRYLDLGGEIRYGERVREILVEANEAVGLELASGERVRAEAVISAADGHATIFDMLGGRYLDDKIRGYYTNLTPFPPLVFAGVGVARAFDNEPRVISGTRFPLKKPVLVGEELVRQFEVRLLNYDPTMAPPGKTVMEVSFPTSYDYWNKLYHEERDRYRAEKDGLADSIVDALSERWRGIHSDVEMVNVATPATFERYTGNWRGSFEGWMPTPEAGFTPLPLTLPKLRRFFMCGQWVAPGGGLPSGVMTGRQVVQLLCKDDGIKFTAMAG